MEPSTAHDPGGPTYYCAKGFEKPRVPVGEAALLEDERRKGLWRLHMPRNGPHLNGYIPLLMLALCANMDAQTVMTAKGAADNVAKYISKYGASQSVAARIGSILDDIVSKLPPATSHPPFIGGDAEVMRQFCFRVLRQSRRLAPATDPSKQAALEEFHQVLEDVAHNRRHPLGAASSAGGLCPWRHAESAPSGYGDHHGMLHQEKL